MLIYTFLFILGLCVGSFLNVLIDRLPNGRSPFKGRSKCDHCNKTLAWYDLVPLVSFIILSGRCRYCHKRLSLQYPLIELLTGFMFSFLYFYSTQPTTFLFPIPYTLVPLLIIFSSFLAILVADLKYQIIPDELIVSAFIGDTLFVTFNNLNYITNFATGLFIMGSFYLLSITTKYFLKKEAMGFGDVKLVFVLGFLLGPVKTLIAMYIAFLTGAAVSIILILIKKKKLKSKIAFGPFLILGTTAGFFYGELIYKWYTTLIR